MKKIKGRMICKKVPGSRWEGNKFHYECKCSRCGAAVNFKDIECDNCMLRFFE